MKWLALAAVLIVAGSLPALAVPHEPRVPPVCAEQATSICHLAPLIATAPPH
jgi:hypothetical protein